MTCGLVSEHAKHGLTINYDGWNSFIQEFQLGDVAEFTKVQVENREGKKEKIHVLRVGHFSVDWPPFTALQQVQMVRRDNVSMSNKARLVGMSSLQIEFACAFAKYIVMENGCLGQLRELVDEAMDILSDDDNRSDDDSDDEQQVHATTKTVQATPKKKNIRCYHRGLLLLNQTSVLSQFVTKLFITRHPTTESRCSCTFLDVKTNGGSTVRQVEQVL